MYRAGNPGFLAGGDQLGVVALADFGKRGHDALYIDDHRLYRAGDNGKLLVQEVARDRCALAHQYLVGRAANTGDNDVVGALGLCKLFHLGAAGRLYDHLGKRRLVAVNDDVDLFCAEHAEVDLRADRNRAAELDVGKVGRDLRAAPSVAKRRLDAEHQEVLVVGVHAFVNHVKQLDDFAVDPSGQDFGLAPAFLLLFGRAGREDQLAFLLAELAHAGERKLVGNLVDVAAGCVDTDFLCDGHELFGVFDLITLGLAVGGHVQVVGDVAPVVGVGGTADRYRANDVSGHYAVGVDAADAALGSFAEWINPAGAHVTHLAADAQLAEPAMGGLLVGAIIGGGNFIAFRLRQHQLSGLIYRLFFHLTLLK